jgi:hypothetical protein
MVELSIATTTVAHGIHYAVVGVGMVGLLALLGPQLVGVRRATSGDDDHSRRLLALTDQISSGELGIRMTPEAPSAWPRREVTEHVDLVRARYLPIAVVSSAAAAGVHAAVGPVHFRELFVFGLFFAGASLAQIGWSLAVAIRPSRTLLLAALIGNGAILLLWLFTRTIGLPGLMAEPETVGVWDLSAGAWELAVVVAVARILGAEPDIKPQVPAWPDWEPLARMWALGSVLVLPVLALTNVGA